METCPMKRCRCEEVVTVDFSSCVSIGVYGCLWVTWVFIGVYRYLREAMGVHGFSDVNEGNVSYEEAPLRRSRYRRFTDDLSSCVSIGVYRCHGCL